MENTENIKEMTYGSALAELESIVAKMQSEDCDIDSLAGYTAKALQLLSFCKKKLFDTDKRVRECLDSLSAMTK